MKNNSFQNKIFTALFFTVVTIFFIYYLFPSSYVQNIILDNVLRINPEIEITIREVKPVFPPGLKFEKVDLIKNEKNLINADFIYIYPDYLSFFSAETVINFKCLAYNGKIQGKINIKKNKKNMGMTALTKITDIDLSKIPQITELDGIKISGILNGPANYELNKKKEEKALLTLTLSKSKVTFSKPVYSLHEIAFTTVNAKISVQGKQVNINKCEFYGPYIDGNFSGKLYVRNNVKQSRINISGSIQLHHKIIDSVKKVFPVAGIFKKNTMDIKLPFKIKGVIADPKFSF